MVYDGPRKVVVIGGGIAGLAAADAITAALAAYPGPLPEGMSVTLIEGESAFGGRASSAPIDEVRALHPSAPRRAHVPHGVHFVWGSYAHFRRLCAGESFTPPRGTPTYCAWLAPPDTVGSEHAPAKVVALHVCDPQKPDAAWDPRARRVLRAARSSPRSTRAIRRLLKSVMNVDVYIDDYLSFLDILFADEDVTPELRWRVFSAGIFASLAREPETSHVLSNMLGGRAPADADIGDLMRPLFDFGSPRFARTASTGFVRSAPSRDKTAMTAAQDREHGALSNTFLAWSALGKLISRDGARLLKSLTRYHPRQSGYLKNLLKAAFSSPFALDVATAIRDTQFGLRNHAGALLQTFDGDDSRRVFQGIAQRIEARSSGRLRCSARTGVWVERIVDSDGAVSGVRVGYAVDRPPAPVPTMRPAVAGETSETLEADAVISTLLPRSLAAVLPEPTTPEQTELLHALRKLGKFMNETINLQLFLPEKHRLPFPACPEGEAQPISISNLEGPFTILVDLERAWSREAFERIRLGDDDRPFQGTAWELVGAYGDLFVHDQFAHPGRYQWPLSAQQILAAKLHDPNDFIASTLDSRPWVHDSHAPGRLPPPPMGEVKRERAAEYLRRWLDEATPIIVANTLRQLAAMPGMARATTRYLEHEADRIDAGEPSGVRYTLVRNCQAETRFFSAEPGLYRFRPHARFETAYPGVFVAGDWTRNGLNLQSMEAAVISGLQAAHAVLERMRAGGLSELRPPHIDPDILPDGAWDTGM